MTRMRSISAGSDLAHDHGARAERIVQIDRYYELEGQPDDDSIAMVVSPCESGKGVIGDAYMIITNLNSDHNSSFYS